MPRRAGFARVLVALALTAAFVGGLTAPAYATRTLGLSTGSFDFSVAPGDSGKGDLAVMNDGNEKLDVLVYSGDQAIDSKGKVTYTIPNRDSGDFANDPASWVSIKIAATTRTIGNTPLISLKPGARVPVHFTFTVPANAPAGDHQLLLFFEMLDASKTSSGASARIAGRLGARVRIRVQGDLVERLEVRPFSVRSLVLGDKMPWTFLVRNEGNIDKSVTAKLSLLDGNENEVWHRTAASDTTVYAGSNLERSGVAKGLPAFGHYKARLTLAYPREGAGAGATVPQQIIKTRDVWIVPVWLAILVVLVIGALLMYLSWRQAVKAALRKAEKAQQQAATATPSAEDAEEPTR